MKGCNFILQAPYLEIKKQMDKQDPLAHPLLQWYKTVLCLYIKISSIFCVFLMGGGEAIS